MKRCLATVGVAVAVALGILCAPLYSLAAGVTP